MDSFINKIFQGDCVDVMKAIPDESIDFAITSPPYDEMLGNAWTVDVITHILKHASF